MAVNPPQNSGSLTLNQAAQAYAQIGELTCEDLNDLNQEVRSNEVAPGTDLCATTTATAYRRDGRGNGRYMKAMAPHSPRPEFEDGYEPSVNDPRQPPCGGGRETDPQGRNHAENKMLFPEMDAQGGGSILMSIMHPTKSGRMDAMPCPSCRQSICEAEQCGIEVYLCRSAGGDPVRPNSAGLCPPETGRNSGQTWQDRGLGEWPNVQG